LYGIEVTDPSKFVLNNLINRVVYRIFNVSDKDSIADIRHFVGLHDTEQYKQRLANFVKKGLLHSSIQCYSHLILSVIFNLLLYSMCACDAFGELKIYTLKGWMDGIRV